MAVEIRNQLPAWYGDFGVEIVANRIRGQKHVHVLGRSDAITTSWRDVWASAGTYTWGTASYSLEILSSSANDAAAGTGARTVTVQGLDANWNEQEETVTMNGVAAVALTGTWVRVNRMFVATAGTYSDTANGANAGTITLRVSGGGVTKCQIGLTATGTYGYGISRQSMYTVPEGYVAVVTDWRVTVEATQTADFLFWSRADADTVAAPFSTKITSLDLPGITGRESGYRPMVPLGPFVGKTDLWWSALASAGTIRVGVDYEIVLI